MGLPNPTSEASLKYDIAEKLLPEFPLLKSPFEPRATHTSPSMPFAAFTLTSPMAPPAPDGSPAAETDQFAP
jgi:hypothetical protein